MNRKIKKFIISLVFLFFCINISFGEMLDESIYTERITPTIKYIEKKQLRKDKWVMFKSIIIDISNDNTSLTPLFNEDNIQISQTLSELSNNKKDIIAGINGDFFDPNVKTTIGPIIKDGDLVLTGSKDTRFNIFGINKNNLPFISNLAHTKLKAEFNNMDILIDYKNKDYTHLGDTILLDSNFKEYSIGNSSKSRIIEIVIENDKVKDILYFKEPVKIPNNGYIISIPEKKGLNLRNIAIGDSFNLVKPKSIEDIKTAVGGGSIIVKDGFINKDFSMEIKGNQPRSAIGFTNDNKIILTTVEGRYGFVPGVSEKELAEIMINLGAHNALNLDGGGSSTISLRKFGESSLDTKNFLSDGGERRIFNGIGVVSKYENTNSISKLKASLSHKHSILNAPIEVNLLSTDKFYNPIKIAANDIHLSSNLEGKFIDNRFYPEETGKGYINIHYKDIDIKKEIIIHDKVSEIRFKNYNLSLQKNVPTKIKPILVTYDGYEIPVNTDLINFDYDSSIISIKDNLITLLEEKNNIVLKASYKNISSELSINSNNYEITELDNFENQLGVYTSYPKDLNGSISIDNYSFNNNGLKLSYDFTTHKNQTRAIYYKYNTPLEIPSDTKKINIDILGSYGNNHWLRMNILDSNDNSHNLTLARKINWKGWKNIEVEIPNHIKGPYKINRIYLAETNFSNSNSGYILMDNLQIKTLKNSNLEKITNYPKLESIDSNYNKENFFLTNENIDIESNNFKLLTHVKELLNEYELNAINIEESYNLIRDNNKLIINLNNNNNTIINYNGKQWLFLRGELLHDNSKNLIIYLNNEFDFINPLEKDLFIEYLKEHQKRNNSKVFIISNNDNFSLSYDSGFPIINIDYSKKFTLKFDFFKDKTIFKLNN